MQAVPETHQDLPAPRVDRPLLFATRTCPACRTMTAWLDSRALIYDKIYAEELPAVAEKYGIRSVPAMMVLHPNGKEARLTGIAEIKAYYQSR